MTFYAPRRFETFVTDDSNLADAVEYLLRQKYEGNNTVEIERTVNGTGNLLLKVESKTQLEAVPMARPSEIILE